MLTLSALELDKIMAELKHSKDRTNIPFVAQLFLLPELSIDISLTSYILHVIIYLAQFGCYPLGKN